MNCLPKNLTSRKQWPSCHYNNAEFFVDNITLPLNADGNMKNVDDIGKYFEVTVLML
jgi:hypothetical protein